MKRLTVIVAGSRHIHGYELVEQAMQQFMDDNNYAANDIMVITGDAKGIDSMAEHWAQRNNVEYDVYSANWGRYGKRAGMIRNIAMANNADVLVAVWDGASKGTKHMIETMQEKNKPVTVLNLQENNSDNEIA